LGDCINIKVIECFSSWDVIKNCEIVITATNSDYALWNTKIIPKNLKLICHIGNKYNGNSEIPIHYYAKTHNLYTDSLEQLMENKNKLSGIRKFLPLFKHFLDTNDRHENYGYSLYLSQGISGIEVILSNWFLSKA
jgi:ornithine cyclodeaminase/alanine dehydrogenase-like protein (mu-crystallin family)